MPHCSEQGGIFFARSSLDPATPEGQLLLATVHYRISFVRHGDPNADKLPSAPEWPPYRPSRAEGDGGGAVLAFAVEGTGESSAAGRKVSQRTTTAASQWCHSGIAVVQHCQCQHPFVNLCFNH